MAFDLLSFDVTRCPMVDSLGNPIQLDAPPAGAAFYHWADLPKATGWFRQASLMLTQLNDVNGRSFQEQKQWMMGLLTSLMNGYNALNIPWATDPEARRLYRQYLAGRPDTDTVSARESDFGDAQPYGGTGWYQGLIRDPRESSGSIIQATKQLFHQYYPGHDVQGHHPLEYNLYLTPTIVAIQPRGQRVPGPTFGENEDVYAQNLLVTTRDWANAAVWSGVPLGGATCVDIRDGLNHCGPYSSQRSWFDFKFDTAIDLFNDGTPLIIQPPLVYFYPWLSEWIRSVNDRGTREIVSCARAYAIWRNREEVHSLGDPSGPFFAQTVAGTQSNVTAQLGQQSPAASIAAATVAAVGAAFTGVTFGISALIGGVAAATITVANSLGAFHGDIVGHGRNDLGWYKPVFERAWLSGDPSARKPDGTPDPASGIPQQVVPDPPAAFVPGNNGYQDLGFGFANQNQATIADLAAQQSGVGMATTAQQHAAVSDIEGYAVDTTDHGMSRSPQRALGEAPAWQTPVLIVGGIAIAAGLLYAGYRLLTPSPSRKAEGDSK